MTDTTIYLFAFIFRYLSGGTNSCAPYIVVKWQKNNNICHMLRFRNPLKGGNSVSLVTAQWAGSPRDGYSDPNSKHMSDIFSCIFCLIFNIENGLPQLNISLKEIKLSNTNIRTYLFTWFLRIKIKLIKLTSHKLLKITALPLAKKGFL
jgi:hypothetical protein